MNDVIIMGVNFTWIAENIKPIMFGYLYAVVVTALVAWGYVKSKKKSEVE